MLVWPSFMLVHAHPTVHACSMLIWDGGWWCVSLNVLLEVAVVMGIAFTNASGGRFGAKNPKQSSRARFRAVSVQMGCCMNTATHHAVT